jgi:hypothetical protein
MAMRMLALTVATAALIAGAEPGVVSNVTVLSDRVPDVSSLDAWQRSFIKPGMSDADKATAVFDSIVAFTHVDPTAQEFIAADAPSARDAIQEFNVYGYGRDATSTAALQLWRALGFNARGWTVNHWGCSPEVEYGGAWHAYDPTMICYFRKAGGDVASVEELADAVSSWLDAKNIPKGDIDVLKKHVREHGRKSGPAILHDCPTAVNNGNFAYHYFGLYTALYIYDKGNRTPFRYEDAYDQGYRVNNQLRIGERLVLRWSNKGLHVNMDGGQAPEVLTASVGAKGPLYYTPALGDIARGRIGNGTSLWAVPLDGRLADVALAISNLTVDVDALRATDANRTAEIVLRRASSYVYLGGRLKLDAGIAAGGRIGIFFSADHGRSWKDIGVVSASGASEIAIPSLRRYDYRLRLTLDGDGTTLTSLAIEDDIQHSQRALPSLGIGDNHISFRAGPDEGTITIQGGPPTVTDKGVTAQALGIRCTGMAEPTDFGAYIAKDGYPTLTIPVETPGDLVRLRFGCSYRAPTADECWDYEVSFDEGATWIEAGRASGPQRMHAVFTTFDRIPPKVHRALVRFRGTARSELVIFRHIVHADYREPAGAFAPIRITYTWSENGQAKKDEHVAQTPSDGWTIRCESPPLLEELTLERAAER